jgi:hypothetical protein
VENVNRDLRLCGGWVIFAVSTNCACREVMAGAEHS